MTNRFTLLLRATLPVVLLDQATKLALERFTPEDWVRPVIPGFFDLVHRHNPGVAFSLFADWGAPWLKWVLILFAFGVIGLMWWLLGDAPAAAGGRSDARARAGIALILGGACGNLIDRLLHGSVIDFADFYIGASHWPAFNVADSAITIGGALVIWDLLVQRKETS
jgi:signal peptidase II